MKRVVRPTPQCGCEAWTMLESHRARVKAVEMRFLRCIERKTRKNKEWSFVSAFEDQFLSGQDHRWLGHVFILQEDKLTRMVMETKLLENEGKVDQEKHGKSVMNDEVK